MPKRSHTVTLDGELLDAVRREAERRGTSEDEVIAAAIRRYIGPGVLDRLVARNRPPEDEAMTTAPKEDAAHRQPGRDLPLTGDEFLARVRAAGPSTPDDASITDDGRRLDSKEAVVAWLVEVEADRSAGRYVEFDEG